VQIIEPFAEQYNKSSWYFYRYDQLLEQSS